MNGYPIFSPEDIYDIVISLIDIFSFTSPEPKAE